MNYLAIDTSGKHLTVIAKKDGKTERVSLSDCMAKHSVVLMDEIDGALSRVGLTPRECDFFGVAVGPGSFTGIRIGISTVKGLCFACGKQAVAVTSFDCIAYSKETPVMALVDAGHGYVYACAYDGEKRIVRSPAYVSAAELEEKRAEYPFYASEPIDGAALADVALGLERAIEAKSASPIPAEKLSALYLRKSSAEENRK